MEQRLTITLTFIPRHYRNDKLLWEHYETVKESHGPLDFPLTLQILKMMILECFLLFFFLLGFTPCKVEQPLRGLELQEKKQKKTTGYRKSV